MKAAHSFPVKTAGGEIELPLATIQQSGFRHNHTGFLCHRRIGHFDSRYIIRIIMAGKFNQIMVITLRRIIGSMYGSTIFIQRNQCFWTGATRRPASLPQG